MDYRWDSGGESMVKMNFKKKKGPETGLIGERKQEENGENLRGFDLRARGQTTG